MSLTLVAKKQDQPERVYASGIDLDETLRGSFNLYFSAKRWTPTQVAKLLQIDAQEFEAFLAGDQGAPLLWLSKTAALYGIGPDEFLKHTKQYVEKGDPVEFVPQILAPAVFRRLSDTFPVELARLLELLGPIIESAPGLEQGLLQGLRITVDGASRSGFSTPHLEHALSACLEAFRRRELESSES